MVGGGGGMKGYSCTVIGVDLQYIGLLNYIL